MQHGRALGTPLRRALAGARLRDVDVAKSLGVDPKTVHRWLDGRLPYPRHRWRLAELLKVHEYDLWPQLVDSPSISSEIHATYAHRGSVPRDVWQHLFMKADQHIGVLVYSGLFLAEDAELMHVIAERARAGVRVRILLGDPDSPHVQQRGAEEGIRDALAAKIRHAIVLYCALLDEPNVEIRLHATTLYNSIYWADNEMLINQHVSGVVAAYAPVLHLRGQSNDEGLLATYLRSFEHVWSDATPFSGGTD